MVSMYNDVSGHPHVKFPNIIIWETSGIKMETWALVSSRNEEKLQCISLA
jgi:hypothetical protein